jgi:hypothetical protein
MKDGSWHKKKRKEKEKARHQWYMPIILAWETEIRRIVV